MIFLEEFKKLANPKNKENVKYDKETYKIFERLCTADIVKNYTIAEDIIANRRAIMKLDGHICRLMDDMQELKKIIKAEDKKE